MTEPIKRLYRSRTERQIAGVCGGIGTYSAMDPVVIRLLLVALTAVTGFVPGIVAYVVAWIVTPDEPLPVASVERHAVDTGPG
ncbi:MAG TPA: PspC domain-containing protein [Candidatus Polarisedimenticolaceae bacterium]|nr:PspC domain-containing protein [Candidatus Polarisedimenticolaceae bacterium]